MDILRWRLACVPVFAACIAFHAAVGAPRIKKKHLLFWRGSYASACAIAQKIHKPMLLVFSMPNGYTKKLDTITFRDPDVMYFVNATCLAFRIEGDAVDSASKAALKCYNVKEFPAAILTRADGGEIDRMVGYYPPKQFLFTFENFLNNVNTIGALRARWEADTNDLQAAYRLAQRFELRVEIDSAMRMFKYIVAHGNANSILVQEAKFQRDAFYMRVFGDPRFLVSFLDSCRVDSLRKNAYDELFTYYRLWKRRDTLLALYARAAGEYPRDAGLLNNYAWTLADWEGNLDTALAAATRAIALAPRTTDYYDTMAEVYSKKGDYKEALRWIDKALRLRKGDAYLKERERFFKSQLAPSDGKHR